MRRLVEHHPGAPQPDGTMLVPGCGRGHEAIREARRCQGEHAQLRWLQADLFDADALSKRAHYRSTVDRLLRAQGWRLGLFFCHTRPGGPPYGSNLRGSGLTHSQRWRPPRGR